MPQDQITPKRALISVSDKTGLTDLGKGLAARGVELVSTRGTMGEADALKTRRLANEVIACDRYANAPAMQVADRAHAFSMLDGDALRFDPSPPSMPAFTLRVERTDDGIHLVSRDLELRRRLNSGPGALKHERKRLLWDNLPNWYRVRWLSEQLALATHRPRLETAPRSPKSPLPNLLSSADGPQGTCPVKRAAGGS